MKIEPIAEQYPCKKPGCAGKVSYVPMVTFGAIESLRCETPRQRRKVPKTVYLTCEYGHTLPYTVTDEREV